MSGDRNPVFQVFANDYLAATVAWPAEAVGALVRLHLAQWIGGTLPLDIGDLARVAGMTPAEFARPWTLYLEARFPATLDGRGRADRTLRQRQEAQESFRRARQASGAKGGKAAAQRRAASATPAPPIDPQEEFAMRISSAGCDPADRKAMFELLDAGQLADLERRLQEVTKGQA